MTEDTKTLIQRSQSTQPDHFPAMIETIDRRLDEYLPDVDRQALIDERNRLQQQVDRPKIGWPGGSSCRMQ